MGLTLTTSPAVEPVSLADMKLHLRVDDTADNDLITSLIVAAREYVENQTGRALISQTWTQTLQRFDKNIYLPRPPLQSVTSISYVDTDGDTQTLDAAYYDVSVGEAYGRIRLAYGYAYPSVRDTLDPISIVYVAGYGDAATDVPNALIAAVKMIVGSWYENREAIVTGTIISTVPMAVDSIIGQYRVMEVC